MTLAQSLLAELDVEMPTTRRLLERVPGERGDWKPHPRSFSLAHLAQLVARMPGWLTMTMRQTSIDLGSFQGYSNETTATARSAAAVDLRSDRGRALVSRYIRSCGAMQITIR